MKYKSVIIVLIVFIGCSFLCLFAYATETNTKEIDQIVSQPSGEANLPENNTASESERFNFDWSTLFGLLGISLLKFIDDRLKIRYKDKFRAYRKYVITATILASVLEMTILICLFWIPSAYHFGSIKNLLLGLIPLLFYIITLFTAKEECSILVLSSQELEKKINDFTESGSSPLGMIVGDMDFLGKVYNHENVKSKGKRKPKDNIESSTQIRTILDNNIDNIQIVCKPPVSDDDRRRIGYLLTKFEQRLSIKFFNESRFPIPNWRGRTMIKQGAQCVVITKKIRKHKEYEYSQHSIDSLPGGLFYDLWRTVWSCSECDQSLLSECSTAYDDYMATHQMITK